LGLTPIVSKIGFDAGKIELRQVGKTRTKMILIRPGDLVLSGINVAKGAIAICEEKIPISATIHYSSYKPRPEKVDILFLWYFLRSEAFRNILKDNMPGGIKTELKPKCFLPIRVPLPPLEQQQRIVTKIEKLTAKIEETKELKREMVEKTQLFFMSTLNRISKIYKEMGEMSLILKEKPRNGYSAKCDNLESGISVLTLTAIRDFTYKPECKKTSETLNPLLHYWLSEGDFLISRSNTLELVGHAAIYSGTPSPCIYPDLMMKLIINESRVDKKFVLYWLQTPLVRKFIMSRAKGTSATMKKISQKTVMKIPFPLRISLEEQRRIVDYLDKLQFRIDELRKYQTETQEQIEALSQSILAKAFRGEL
ncbi:restriction endonuclease subunit S, partial [bacterium]|nr:restriction endonuclease subunit S [bacterium]